jgi:signal transduction histidine kinase
MLEALLRVPGVEVRYVADADPAAPGFALARENGIACVAGGDLGRVFADPTVDLVLETGDRPGASVAPEGREHPASRVLDGAGARLVSRLLAELTAVQERATLEQARYLRQASHQVKSPLSSIETSANILLGGYAGELPERARDVVQKIHARCEAALRALAKRRMLADLRCLAGDALETSEVHLGELVSQAVESQAGLAGTRGVDIRVAPAPEPDLVRCDPHKTVVLLSELVENAVVYSADRGVVEVACAATPDGDLAVAVRDHGIGIPARCLPRIFDEDYRADVAARHYPDGAGLGLTVAREIARLQRFALAAESDEGHGSVFTLRIPAAQPD